MSTIHTKGLWKSAEMWNLWVFTET